MLKTGAVIGLPAQRKLPLRGVVGPIGHLRPPPDGKSPRPSERSRPTRSHFLSPRDCRKHRNGYPALDAGIQPFHPRRRTRAGHAVARRALVIGTALACLPRPAHAKRASNHPPRRWCCRPQCRRCSPPPAFHPPASACTRNRSAAPPGRLISLNADQPFQMASTTKLVTALAALDLLGPDYRWRTQAYLDGMLYGGRLLGDLIIVGGGDASLSSDGLRAWFWPAARARPARGVGRHRARPLRVQPAGRRAGQHAAAGAQPAWLCAARMP